MFKVLLLTLVGATATLAQSQNSFVYGLGQGFAEFSRGTCDVWVDDDFAAKTTCTDTCDKTKTTILSLFDNTQYTGNSFNTPDALNKIQTVNNAFLL